MSSDLKPCPFCGSGEVGTIEDSSAGDGYVRVNCSCECCGASSSVFASPTRDESDVIAMAEAGWNRRHGDWRRFSMEDESTHPNVERCMIAMPEPGLHCGYIYDLVTWHATERTFMTLWRNRAVTYWRPLPDPPIERSGD